MFLLLLWNPHWTERNLGHYCFTSMLFILSSVFYYHMFIRKGQFTPSNLSSCAFWPQYFWKFYFLPSANANRYTRIMWPNVVLISYWENFDLLLSNLGSCALWSWKLSKSNERNGCLTGSQTKWIVWNL